MKSAEEFLQFLYDLNVIAFIERTEGQAGYEASTGDEKFIRWCFRERSPTNISPKVKTEVEYEIHYGLANTLNLGRRLRRTSKTNAEKPEAATDLAQRGRVKWYDPKRGFGFIEQTGLPIDIFLPKRELPKGIRNVAPGQELEYELKRDKSGRLLATSVRLQKSSR